MNTLIVYPAEFDEEHPDSLKPLPREEQIDAELKIGYEGLIVDFRTPNSKDARRPMSLMFKNGDKSQKTPLAQRLDRWFVKGGGKPQTFNGYWKFNPASTEIDRRSHGGTLIRTYESWVFVMEATGADRPMAKIALRMQDPGDIRRVQFCPEKDMRKTFTGAWTDDHTFTFSVGAAAPRASNPMQDEIDRLGAMDDGDIHVMAEKVGLKWVDKGEKSMSRPVFIEKLAKKRLEKRMETEKAVTIAEPVGTWSPMKKRPVQVSKTKKSKVWRDDEARAGISRLETHLNNRFQPALDFIADVQTKFGQMDQRIKGVSKEFDEMLPKLRQLLTDQLKREEYEKIAAKEKYQALMDRAYAFVTKSDVVNGVKIKMLGTHVNLVLLSAPDQNASVQQVVDGIREVFCEHLREYARLERC